MSLQGSLTLLVKCNYALRQIKECRNCLSFHVVNKALVLVDLFIWIYIQYGSLAPMTPNFKINIVKKIVPQKTLDYIYIYKQILLSKK